MDQSARENDKPASGPAEEHGKADETESHLSESVPDTTDENDRPVDNPSG
ncbi:hypothetical protein [Microbacterium rhizomatis]|nr:hypothetical protein [Microbacterium rhizomatis]